MTCAIASFVLCAYVIFRLRHRVWGPRVLPVASLLVASTGPGVSAFRQIQYAPIGVLAIVGSFLLFALGTWIALSKHRWNKIA